MRSAENRKGRDIGYALATRSCEGANSVEACTVTAPDAITAFAVPNPNCSSQSRRFFQVWSLAKLPLQADYPAYFGLANFYLSQPFQPSTEATLTSTRKMSMPLFGAAEKFRGAKLWRGLLLFQRFTRGFLMFAFFPHSLAQPLLR